MRRTASLGMYDAGPARAANDAMWAAIAARLRTAGIRGLPAALDRTRGLEAIWADSGLLLAQTCGYPLATLWRGRLRYVATPAYHVEGCAGFAHRSRIVVRHDGPDAVAALRGGIAAVNDPASNTGMNLLRATIAPHATDGRFFGGIVASGSHAASAMLVADGAADAASIDSVSFAHFARDRPDVTERLRTIAWSEAVPCLPFVTAGDADDGLVDTLQAALAKAVDDVPAAAATLFLAGIAPIDPAGYDRVLAIEAKAVGLGYPRLA